MTSPLVKKAHLLSMNIIQAWPVILFILMAVTFLSKTAGAALIDRQIDRKLEIHSANSYTHQEISDLDKQQAVLKTQNKSIMSSMEDIRNHQEATDKKLDKILEYLRNGS